MTIFRGLVLLLALAAGTTICAEEKPPETEPTPAQRVQIANYIAGLSDESFDTRTASKLALLKMGDLVKAQLLEVQKKKDTDPETLAAVASVENILENPMRHARVGDWVIHHSTIKSTVLNMDSDTRVEVKKITATEVTLECTVTMTTGGMKQTNLVTVPLELQKPDPCAKQKEVSRGVDQIFIQERTLQCEWVKYEFPNPGKHATYLTFWKAAGLPPLVTDYVKTEYIADGLTDKSEVRDFGRGPDPASMEKK